MSGGHELNHLAYKEFPQEARDLASRAFESTGDLYMDDILEQSSRGSTLLDVLGKTERNITPEELEYLKAHPSLLQDTGDQGLVKFVRSIKDSTSAAEFINKWTLGVAIPINGSIIKSIFSHPSTLKEGKFIRDGNNS